MTITFTEIQTRSLPEIQMELNLSGGAALQSQQDYKDVWIFAEKISTGSAADNEVTATPFSSDADAKDFFGVDANGNPSFGAAMAAYYMTGSSDIGRPKARCWGVALPEPASGAAATQTLTLSGTATAAGTWIFEVGAHRFSVAVAVGDTEDDLGAAIVDAWNALPTEERAPVAPTYDNVTKVVTFTATNKGATGNQIAVSTYSDPSCGITATWGGSALSGGSGYPTITTALSNIEAVKTPLLVTPWDAGGAASILESLVDHLNTKAAAGSELPCRMIVADRDSPATLVSEADALDDDDGQRVIYVGAPTGSSPWPGELAARVAATDAAETHLARSLDGASLNGFEPWPDSENFSKTEANTLIQGGVTPLWIPPDDDQVRIARLMADRTTIDGVSVEVEGALMINLDYCRDYVRSVLSSRYSRMSIVDGEVKTTAAHVTTLGSVKATVYGALKDLEANGNLVDVDSYWAQAQVELVSGRVQMQIPGEMVPQWHSTYIRLDAEV